MSAFQSKLTNLQDTIMGALSSTSVKAITNINDLETYFVSLGYYSQLKKENEILTEDMSNNNTDLFTNNRKTYYENQYIESLNQWYTTLFSVYMFLLIIYVLISFFVITSNMSFTVIKCLLLFLYPFITSYLSQIILNLNNNTTSNPYLSMVPSASNTTSLFSTPYNYKTEYIT